MVPEKCRTCEWYDTKTEKCSYWEVGCFYVEEEEDTDDSGYEQED